MKAAGVLFVITAVKLHHYYETSTAKHHSDAAALKYTALCLPVCAVHCSAVYSVLCCVLQRVEYCSTSHCMVNSVRRTAVTRIFYVAVYCRQCISLQRTGVQCIATVYSWTVHYCTAVYCCTAIQCTAV
eukprot:Lankesteria_metandrocarpae@DN1178_c0_g1_i1.p2